MNVTLHPTAHKQLIKLPLSEKKKIIRKLALLSSEPFSGKALQGEYEGWRSLRAWPYRIIYKIIVTRIVVFTISHRQSAY